MRIDLEIIKKIEFYLAGEMSSVERIIFEQEMASSSELKEAVDQQKNLVKALQKSQLKNIAINAASKYQRNRVLRMGGLVLCILVLFGGVYMGYSYINNQRSGEQNAVVQNTNPVPVTTQTIKDSVITPIDSTFLPSSNQQMVGGLVSNDIKTVINKTDIIKSNVDISQNNNVDKSINTDIYFVDTNSILSNSNTEMDYPQGNPYKIFGSFEKKAEQFTLSANKDIYIQGTEGTMLKIPAKSLVDKNQQIVKGDVEVILIEFYKKSDIVLGDLHTMSDGKQLESGGMIYISVQQNGQELQLKKGKEMQILFGLRAVGDGMQVFRGDEREGDVNWLLQSELNKEALVIKDNQNGYFGKVDSVDTRRRIGFFRLTDSQIIRDYAFDFDKFTKFNNLLQSSTQLGWINCDRFTNYSNLTDLNITVNGSSDVAVRIVFKELNSVMAAYDVEGKKRAVNVPVGKRVTIIAFTSVNEEPYFASREIVISKEGKVTLDLQKTTMIQLEEELKKLN